MSETANTDEEEEQEAEEQGAESQLDDPEWLEEQYHGEDRTQADIGEELGVTSSTVSHHMKKHGIETRANVVEDERLEDPEWLEAAYWGDEIVEGEDGATMQQIADEIGCSDGTVMRRMHQFDIEVRRGRSSDEEDEEDEEEPEEEAEDDEGSEEEPEDDEEDEEDEEEPEEEAEDDE